MFATISTGQEADEVMLSRAQQGHADIYSSHMKTVGTVVEYSRRKLWRWLSAAAFVSGCCKPAFKGLKTHQVSYGL